MTKGKPSSINENKVLLEDKSLIVLRELLWYCEENNCREMQYSKLKELSNETLSWITSGQHTDLGGSFEAILKRLESADDPKKRYLKRERRTAKSSFIIPDIGRIRNLLESKGLIEAQVNEFTAADLMTEPVGASLPGISGIYRIPFPSDKIKVYRYWRKTSKKTKIYSSDLVEISIRYLAGRKLKLTNEQIQKLISYAEEIKFLDDKRPFEITIEYKGEPFFMSWKDRSDTFAK